MVAGNSLSGLTAFTRAVHLGLARMNARAALASIGTTHCMENAICGCRSYSRARSVYKGTTNSANQGRIVHETPHDEASSKKATSGVTRPEAGRSGVRERDSRYVKTTNFAANKKISSSGTGRDEHGQDINKRVSLNDDSRLVNQQNEDLYNYYDVKDPRNAVPSPGFDENDRRAKITSRDDATDEIDLEFDVEPLSQQNGIDQTSSFAEKTVTLKKPCVVTKRLITVEAPIHSLTGRDALEAVLYGTGQYAPFNTVELLYKHIHKDNAAVKKGERSGSALLASLEDHVCLLARNRGLRVREAAMLAMIYDHQGTLRPEIRDALAMALQMQLCSFRPYDIAAVVAVYGKYGSRYRPLLNTLGLVFYDIMIAGKTAIAPQGPSVDETLAVIEAYSKVGMPIKRMTDAAFGTLYQHVDQMDTDQMLTVLDAFFRLSKDGNFVELYTKIIGRLFGQPVLFVDGFQKYAEQHLNANFQSPMEDTTIATIGDKRTAYPPSEVMRLMIAMAKCKSEHLIHSVHSRIEFKRLWSGNIRNNIMPWKASVVEPNSTIGLDVIAPGIENPTMVEAGEREIKTKLDTTAPDQKLIEMYRSVANNNSGVTGDNSTNHGANLQKVLRDGQNQVNSNIRSEAEILHEFVGDHRVVSYVDQIPSIYQGMLQMLSDTLGYMHNPKIFLQLIHDANRSVVEKALVLCKQRGIDLAFERLVQNCRAHYPFIASLNATMKNYEAPTDATMSNADYMPLFKVEDADVQVCLHAPEDVMIVHADQLIKSVEKESANDEQSDNAGSTSHAVYPSLCSYDRRVNEAMRALSVRNGANLDGLSATNKVSANDLALTIRAIQDYSRYSDHLHAETVNAIAALYFRMLFVAPRPPVASDELHKMQLSEFLSCIQDATPISLMVDHGHLPFTQNKNAVGFQEFHQVRHGEYQYYRPMPLFADLFRGNAALYGLMMYTIAHKMQYSGMHRAADCDLASTIQVIGAMRHVLHPFYIIATGKTNKILKWHILYYKGALNVCHRVNGTKVKGNGVSDVNTDAVQNTLGKVGDDAKMSGIPKSQSSHEALHSDDTDADHHSNEFKDGFDSVNTDLKELELIRDRTFAEAAADISKVMQCPLFHHSATIFTIVLLEYISQAIQTLQDDANLISLNGCAEISETLSMLMAFQQMMEMELDVNHKAFLHKCQNDMAAIIASKVMSAAEDEPGVGLGPMALPIDTAWRDEPHGGFAERVDALSLRMERQDFLSTARALAMYLNTVDLTEPLANAVHTIMQIMYKRLPYMADSDLVDAAITVIHADEALARTQNYSDEDPAGRLAQLVRILRVQCRQLLEVQPAHTDEVYTFSTRGRLAMIAAIG
ncbi:hypothetical protein, conserved [Babesia ovata]|uniref:Uncharacterized protein n=1 Tax=Babesia ovata TaxID=189622 RepID=A0A2H6KCK8_9APIC|nr:uncharacterized protein BOVATA_022260 [Babesia ovata]GBE60733.1 hypothetical protein, conserved [Babesia ovata]